MVEAHAEGIRPAGLGPEQPAGIRGKTLTPERPSKARKTDEKPTTELFIAGPREAFRNGMAGETPQWRDSAQQQQMIKTGSMSSRSSLSLPAASPTPPP